VVTSPPIGQLAQQNVVSELTKANAIVDRLIQTSPNIIHLMKRLRENISAQQRTVIKDQLANEFQAGLDQGGVPPVMVPGFAQLLSHNTIREIYMVSAEHGDHILVYFLCKTVQSLYSLGQMIVSGFMHAVFAVAIESVACTTVDVYVRADEYNLRLLCISCPENKGLSVDRQGLLTLE